MRTFPRGRSGERPGEPAGEALAFQLVDDAADDRDPALPVLSGSIRLRERLDGCSAEYVADEKDKNNRKYYTVKLQQ